MSWGVLASRTAQTPEHLWLQLDNTSAQNRNTTVLTWLSWLVSTKKFRTVSWESMQVGHTHIDQDQRFSVCGAHLSKESRLETPQDFAAAIRTVEPVRGRQQVVTYMQACRNWNSFFAPLSMQFHGHADKQSVHSYTFVRYEDMIVSQAAAVVEVGDLEGHVFQDTDVVMLTKLNMCDKELSQPPTLCLPAVRLGLLDGNRLQLGHEDVEVLPRTKLDELLARRYLRSAARIVVPPWNLVRASAYLQKWVENNQNEENYKHQLWDLRFVLQLLPPPAAPAQPILWEDFGPVQATVVAVEHRAPKAGARWAPKAKPKAKVKAAAAQRRVQPVAPAAPPDPAPAAPSQPAVAVVPEPAAGQCQHHDQQQQQFQRQICHGNGGAQHPLQGFPLAAQSAGLRLPVAHSVAARLVTG